MIRVYVAGPFSGNVTANVMAAIAQGDAIDALGFDAEVPHLFMQWDMLHHHDYEHWMKKCLSKLDTCQILFRMPGDSPGADREVAHAHVTGIPVVFSIPELLMVKRIYFDRAVA
jgi:hypothetical protein